MRHHRVYEMLKRAGHSPLKALEIVVGARRGDERALCWIRLLHKFHQRVTEGAKS